MHLSRTTLLNVRFAFWYSDWLIKYYPRNFNFSKCCLKPICTQCFLQIRQNNDSGVANCPFCVAPQYGVFYLPPEVHINVLIGLIFRILPSFLPVYCHFILESYLTLLKNEAKIVAVDYIRPLEQRAPTHHRIRRVENYSRRYVSQNFRNRLPRRSSIGEVQPGINPRSDGERDFSSSLEEIMVMEAIRLSLLDQERTSSPINSRQHTASPQVPLIPSASLPLLGNSPLERNNTQS